KVGLLIAVACFHHLQAVELATKDIGEERRKAIKTTCRLPPNSSHHELHVLLTVATSQYPRNYIEQAIVQSFLISRELNSKRLGLSSCELADVPTARSVNQRTKRIQLFDGSCELHTVR